MYGEVIYKSPTDRHLFGEQFYYQIEIVILLLQQITLQLLRFNKEMSINYGEGTNPAELMLRVIRSCQNIEEFTKERIEDTSALYGFHTTL